MALEIKNFRHVNKGSIRLKFDIFFPILTLTIRECMWMESNGKEWINFPARQYEEDGKKKYYQYIHFGEMKERLQEAVKKEVDKFLAAPKLDELVEDDNELPF